MILRRSGSATSKKLAVMSLVGVGLSLSLSAAAAAAYVVPPPSLSLHPSVAVPAPHRRDPDERARRPRASFGRPCPRRGASVAGGADGGGGSTSVSDDGGGVGDGDGRGSAAARSELRRTAEHLDRLRRRADPAVAAAATTTTMSATTETTTAKAATMTEAGGAASASATAGGGSASDDELFERLRMRSANDLKEELRGLKLKSTGRKPDLARRLADHYNASREEEREEGGGGEGAPKGGGNAADDEANKVETVPAQHVRSANVDRGEEDGSHSHHNIVPLTEFAGITSLSSAAGTALARASFHSPSSIQSEAVPPIGLGRSCILHAETGSGKTLAYLLPITELLWRESELGLTHGTDDGVGYGLILTPTRELAAQVAGVATVLAPPGSVRLIGRPTNLLRDGKSERGEARHGGRRTTDDDTDRGGGAGGGGGGRTVPRLIVGSAKAIGTSLFGNDKMPAPPTSKPEAKLLLGNVRWLVMDEVDRLLHVKRTRSEKAYKRHEKPAAIIASAVARHTLGKVQVVAASATVGRPLRRELARVLGLSPQECPPVVRGSTGPDGEGDDGDAAGAAAAASGGRFADITRSGGGGGGHLGRAVTIPSTVQNYVLPCFGDTSGSLLTTAASVIKDLSPPREGGKRRGGRTLLVLSKGCELSVKTALGALKHFECDPPPRSLIDALEADGTDRLIEVHREVSGATGVGQSSRPAALGADAAPDDDDGGYLLVTGEDSVRGLHLDNLDTVIVVGRPFGPDEYTHIAGRTGRAGRKGKVINIVSYSQAQALSSWEKMLGVDFVPLEESDVPDL